MVSPISSDFGKWQEHSQYLLNVKVLNGKRNLIYSLKKIRTVKGKVNVAQND